MNMQAKTKTTEKSDIQKETMREMILAEGRTSKSLYTTSLYSEGYVEAANNTVFCFRNTFDAYNKKNKYQSSIISMSSFSSKNAIYELIHNFYSDTSTIMYKDEKLVHKRYAVIKPERITLIMGYASEDSTEDIYDMFLDADYYGVFICIDINTRLFTDAKWKNEMKDIIMDSKTYGKTEVYKSIVLKDIFRTGSNLDFKVEYEEQ